MRNIRIAELLFNRPLMISQSKHNAILHALGPRFNIDISSLPPGVQMAQASERERSTAGYTIKNGVAVIGVYGPLLHRVMASDYPSGGPTTYSEIIKAFDMAMADDSVRELFMVYDTPGGEVHGAFDAADHMYASRGKKPSTAVVNESAHSAGYLLASAAGRIIIPRTAGVGSIGVIATHADFSRAEDAAGISVTHVIAGARKADFSPHMPLSDPALQSLQGMVNDTYEMFCETVARHRKMSVKDVKATEAGIFEGKKAVTARLADEVMPADKAIATSAGKSRSTVFMSSNQKSGKESKMDVQQLRELHPDLVAQIETDAKKGMIAEADAATARTAAVTAEQTRVCALAAAAFGEESGKKFAAIAGKGLTAEDMTALGISCAPANTGKAADLASRQAILNALQSGAPAGLQPLSAKNGKSTPTINTAAIYDSRKTQK